MRTIRVAADIDKNNENANANEARRTLEEDTLADLVSKFPGVSYTFQGEQKDQQQSMEEMGIGFLFALLAMFVLMAIPLRSYVQPIIVMSVIPFGIVGAVVATYLGQAVGWYRAGEGAGFLGAVVGAVIVLFIYNMVTRRSSNSV